MPEDKKEPKTGKAAKAVAKSEVKKAAETVIVAPSDKPVKRLSFEQWAARRGVPAHHRGGLRAFVKNSNKHRTLEEWDLCFAGY